MIHEIDIAILKKLYEVTSCKKLHWNEDSDGWVSAHLGGRDIAFRFLYYEATNQIGADRRMIEFTMPGRNAVFACGTEGFDLLMEIYLDGKSSGSFDPLKFLKDELEKLH